ncbi:hypothetical protein QEG11_003412, partial [Stenotrophomonas maltophilia]|nr:hypothetical protein [Stenotrophomonas maltophilia]
MPEPTLRRDPLELIVRMLVGGSFREPSDGRSSMPPLTSADIAGALGMMRDSVAKQAVLAVAPRGQDVSLSSLGRSQAKRMMRQIQWQRRGGAKPAPRMDDPADRWRMRLVLQDAVNDLMWPEGKIAAQVAAKAAKMRKGDYLGVHGIAAATLCQALEDGRKEYSAGGCSTEHSDGMWRQCKKQSAQAFLQAVGSERSPLINLRDQGN